MDTESFDWDAYLDAPPGRRLGYHLDVATGMRPLPPAKPAVTELSGNVTHPAGTFPRRAMRSGP